MVFGQKHRLAVMVAIAQSDGIINPGDLAAELGFRAQSSVQDALRDLQAAGLISRAAEDGGRTYYRRNHSAAWTFATELLAQALSRADQPGSVRSPW